MENFREKLILPLWMPGPQIAEIPGQVNPEEASISWQEPT